MKFYKKKMEKVSFFFLIASLALAHGFKTQKCNQDLLEVRTMGMMKCLQARWEEVEHLFKANSMQTLEDNPLGCDFIDKNIACWNEHLGSCFIDDFRKDMATLLDASYENQAYVACHRNGVRRTNQLTLVQKRLAQKYAQYQYQPEKLKEIIQLDNQCSYFTFVRDFQEEWECFLSEGNSKIKDLYSTLYPKYSSGSQGNDVVLPVCDVLAFGLDCFHLRECLNDQEGKFLANLIVTFYKMAMTELDRALAMFPGDKLYDYLIKNDFTMYDARMGVQLINGMVKDFKTTSCQETMKKWKDCTKDCSYQSVISDEST